MSSTSSIRSNHLPLPNVRGYIENLAARLAEPTSKITVKADEKGQAALWEEEMTTHRAGFTTPSRLGRDYVATRRRSLPDTTAKRNTAWGMAIGGALIGICGVAMLASAVVPYAAGAVILVLAVGVVAAAAVHYWRAGAPQRALVHVRDEARRVQGHLESLLYQFNNS